MAIKMAPIKISNRTKNIAKSFGYAAIDAAKELNPTLARVYNDTKSMMSDVKTSMRNMNTNSISQATKDLTDPKGQNAISNLIDDFKTGKWYNKDREASGFFDDEDFNFDDDFEDWGDDEQSSSEKSVTSAMSSSIDSMKNLSGSIAVSMGKTTAASAEYIAKSSRAESQAIYGLTKTGFNNISTILLNIDSKLDAIIQIQHPLALQAQNTYIFQTKATEFFDTATDRLNSINANLEQLVANTSALNANPGGKKYKDKGLSSLIFGDEFSVSSYFDLVKDNIKEQTEMYKGILDLSSMAFGKNGKNMSPIGMAMVSAMKIMTPGIIKESMSNLNSVVEGAIPALIQSLRKDTKNAGALGQILRDIFLPDVKTKVKIDTGNYKKGPVPWDGIARKSLVEVIPTYLAKIYASLGGEEKYFDYGSGKFVSISKIKDYQRERRESLAKRSGGDFRDDLLKAAKNDAQLAKEIESYFDKALDVGHNSSKLRRANAEDIKYLKKEMGLSDSSIALINQVINEYQKNHDTAKLMKYTLGLVSAQGSLATQIKREEEKGYSVENYIENNFTETKDKWNMTQSEYMHGMYQMVGNIYAILGGGQYKGTNLFNTNNGSVLDVSKVSTTSSKSSSNEDIHINKSDKEFEREERAKIAKERIKETKSSFSSTMTGILKNMKDARDYRKNPEKYKNRKQSEFNKAIGGKDFEWYEKPFISMANAIDKLSDGITDLFWGDHGDESLFDTLKNKINDTFNNIKKGIFEKFKNSSLAQAMKEEWGNIRDNFKEGLGKFAERATSTYNYKQRARATKARLQEKYAAKTESIPQAARGRKVTRTGLIAVSEGELIIPSEYNPFYHGITNKAKQIRDESKIVKGYFGSYSKGGTVGAKAGEIVGSSADYVVSGFNKFFQTVFKDTTDEKEINKAKKAMHENVSKVFKDAGYNKGAMGIGAIAGAGLGLLSGSIVGPIGGAAIGAGIGLLSKSETLQKIVFGEITEDGIDKRTAVGKAKDAIIGKVNEVLKSKKLPAITGGAALGVTASLIGGPFGIVGGALMGSAVGLMSTTEEFKNFMFGKEGEEDDSFTGLLRNKIVHNLDEIFHNTWNMIEGIGNRLWFRLRKGLRTLNNKFTAWLTKKSQDGSLLGKFVGGAGKIVKAPVRAVGKGLDVINKGTKKFNLKHGFNVYDRELGRNMLASEREEARNTYKVRNNMYNDFDEVLAGTAYSELDEVYNKLKALQDPKNLRREAVNSNMKDMYDSLKKSGVDVDGKLRGKIDSLIRAGKYEKALNLLKSEGKLEGASESSISDILSGTVNSNNDAGNAENLNRIEQNLLKKLGLPSKDVDIQTALSLVKSEKSTRESLGEDKKEEELKAKELEKDESDYKVSILNILTSVATSSQTIMDSLLDANTGGITGLIKGKWAARVTKSSELKKLKAEMNGESVGDAADKIHKAKRGPSFKEALSANTNENENKTVSQIDFLGNIHQYSENEQGELTEVTNDKETDASRKKIDKFTESVYAIPGIGAAIGGLGGIFGSIKDKLFGNEEEKTKGIFDLLQEKLFGENGYLSGIFNWLTGSAIGTAVKSVLKGGLKGFLKKLLVDVGIGAFIYASFSGKLDSILNKITGGAFGDDDNGNRDGAYNTTATTKDGVDVHKNADGKWLDDDGNEYSDTDISTQSVKSERADVDSYSTKFTKNFVRGAVTGKGSVTTALVKKTNIGKALTKKGSTYSILKNAAKDISKNEAKAAGYIISDTALQITSKLGDFLKKVPILKRVMSPDKIDDMMTSLGGKITKKLSGDGVKKFASAAATALPLLKLGLIIADFTTGYQDARTTLGITAKPSFGQRVLSGLIRTLKNLIPYVGTLIPDSLIVDVVVDYLAPALGMDVEELKNQRAAADEEVAAYNEENGTDLTKEEYMKQVLHDYTWTERIGNFAKTAKEKIKTGWSNAKESIKTGWSNFKTGVGNAGEAIKTGWNNVKEGVSDAGEAVTGFFAKIGTAIKDKFVELKNKVVGSVKNISTNIQSIFSYTRKGDVKGVLGYEAEETDKDNPIGGFQNAILTVAKFMNVIPAGISWVGHKVKDKFVELKDKVVGGVKNISTNMLSIFNYARKGDVKGLLNYTPQATDEDNPIGGLQTGLITAYKFMNIIPAGISWVGHKVKDKFIQLKDKVVGGITNVATNMSSMRELSTAGDVKGLLTYTPEATDEDNPIGGLQTGLLTAYKFMNVIPAGIHWIGNKIHDAWVSFTEPITEDTKAFGKGIKKMNSAANNGEPGEVSDVEFDPSEENHLGGLFSVGFKVAKFGFTVKAYLRKFGKWFKKFFGGIFGGEDTVDEEYEKDQEEKDEESKSSNSGSGSGIHRTNLSGGDSGFISQNDPRYKNKSFAGSTFGDKGCGPSVASMAANALGTNLSVSSAIDKSTKYQTANGVDAGYFRDALGSAKIGTSYMQGSDRQQQILNALAGGEKVILLGRDSNNRSKANSPFGPSNHYVLATGYDRNGIIINDPESNGPARYDWNILNNVKLGIGTSKISTTAKNKFMSGVSGGKVVTMEEVEQSKFTNDYNEDNAKRVWEYFIAKGYSPAATAGILGNMYAESRIDPTLIQSHGKGPAAGIVQLENYNKAMTGDKKGGSRFYQMMKFAENRGKSWTDLDSQLMFIDQESPLSEKRWGDGYDNDNFEKAGATGTTYEDWKKSEDVDMATRQFTAAYERPAHPDMVTRTDAAKYFFNTYSDPNSVVNTDMSGTNTDNTTEYTPGFFNIISNLSTLITKAFGGLANNGSSESDAATSASNSPSEQMKSILGTIEYSMNGDRDPDKGNADCSSTVRWAFKKAGGPNIGETTPDQYVSPNLSQVQYQGGNDITQIYGGAKKDDVMFFSRRGYSFTKGRENTDYVGHVGIYLGGNKYIHHPGPGKGPEIKRFTPGDHLIKISRLNKPLGQEDAYDESGNRPRNGNIRHSGSNRQDTNTNTNPPVAGFTEAMNETTKKAEEDASKKSNSGLYAGFTEAMSGGASGIFDSINTGVDSTSKIKTIVSSNNSSKGIDPAMVNKLIGSIAGILENIADNTSPIEKIYNVLVQSLSGGGSKEQNTTQPIKPINKNNNIPKSSDLDNNIIELVGTLAQLAKG